jgi:DNA-binding transcriptional regulator YiaG
MTKRKKRRKRRSADEIVADLEARIEELRARTREREGFSPESVHAERQRLELSAANYAQLVGVSPLTIYSWEHGRTSPRKAQLERWQAVKGIARDEAWAELGIEGEFSPEEVFAERERLELSAADYGELVGVSALTIYNWEKGKTKPREAQLQKWLAVRGIGKRKAWKSLGIV